MNTLFSMEVREGETVFYVFNVPACNKYLKQNLKICY